MANYTIKAQRAADTAEMLAIIDFSRSLRGIQQADRLSALVWIFCMRCGHSKLTSPRWLVAQVKGAPDHFDALARGLWCERCAEKGVELMSTQNSIPCWTAPTRDSLFPLVARAGPDVKS